MKQKTSLTEGADEKEWNVEEEKEEERRPGANIHVNCWTSRPTVDCTELNSIKSILNHCTNPHTTELTTAHTEWSQLINSQIS